MSTVSQSALPGSLPEIADHIGRDAACAIALAYGGMSWRVPSRLDSRGGHALAACVEEDAARILITAFGGHVLDIPLARRQVVSWLAPEPYRCADCGAAAHHRAQRAPIHQTEQGIAGMSNNEAVTALPDRIAVQREGVDMVEVITTAILENNGVVDIPQAARGVVEIQLHGIVSHGQGLHDACLAWAKAAQALDH